MKFESREYKMLVKHEPFVAPAEATKAVWDEVEEAVRTLATVRTKGKFDEQETPRIVFLDTPDYTLRRDGLVLRQRVVNKAVEYTLKCRSEDRYLAAGTDVRAADGQESERKLEEDIVPPFRCRFSHSMTITVAEDGETARDKMPKTLGEASVFVPMLQRIETGASARTRRRAVLGCPFRHCSLGNSPFPP